MGTVIVVTLPVASVMVSDMLSVLESLIQYMVDPSTLAVPLVGHVPVHSVPNMLSTNCLDRLA